MILMYHKVFPEAPTMWWVTVDEFHRQLTELRYRKVVYLDDYDPSDPDQVVLTFDGVYDNLLHYGAALLKKFDYPFELFITSDYVGADNAFDTSEPSTSFASVDELKQLVSMGGRLQWHTKSHTNLASVHDMTVIEEELNVPVQLRELDDSGFGWFAYPHGEFNDVVLSEVRKRFRGAVSCVQGNDTDRYMLNRVTATNQSKFAKASTSVIIASYNYGAFLVEAIESVLRQTLPVDEILISDDCSSDETFEIATYYQKQHPELIKVNRNNTNLGIIAHFNKAISMTSGEYICILGADNRFRSDYLERTVSMLDADDSVGIAYTDFALFGKRAEIEASSLSKNWTVREVGGKFHVVSFPGFDSSARALLQGLNFIHGSSLFRRKAFEQVGGYLNVNPIPEDHGLFKRIIDAGWGAQHCPWPLLEYRQHSREQANIHATSEALLNHYRKQCKKALSERDELAAYINYARTTWAWKLATPLRVAENLIRRWLKK